MQEAKSRDMLKVLNTTKFKSPVSKALIVGAVDRRVDDLVSVDGALNSTVLKSTN